jgi:Trk K+ transport system NAD-binding subunit
MKKFAVIGLGNFGMNIARSLVENNCEVSGSI